MSLPPGIYLVRATPAATALSYQQLSDHLCRAVAALTTPGPPASAGQPGSQKQVTSD